MLSSNDYELIEIMNGIYKETMRDFYSEKPSIFNESESKIDALFKRQLMTRENCIREEKNQFTYDPSNDYYECFPFQFFTNRAAKLYIQQRCNVFILKFRSKYLSDISKISNTDCQKFADCAEDNVKKAVKDLVEKECHSEHFPNLDQFFENQTRIALNRFVVYQIIKNNYEKISDIPSTYSGKVLKNYIMAYFPKNVYKKLLPYAEEEQINIELKDIEEDKKYKYKRSTNIENSSINDAPIFL